MVDSIGTKTVATPDRLVAPVASVARPAAAARPGDAAGKRLELSAIADLGKSSPADEQRIEEVKRAVRNGTYPITPETIADRMLALKLYWSPKK